MIIYKITNQLNGKIYIGKTTGTMKDRFQRHVQDAMSNRLDTHLARAIRRDGKDNFTIELVETVATENELNEREKFWIKHFDSYNSGYNETEGGDGGNTYGAKTEQEMTVIKNKIRETKIGSKNPQARAVKCKNINTGEELHFGSAAEGRDYFGESNHQFITRRCLNRTRYLYKGEWNFAYEENEYNQNCRPDKSIRKSCEIIVEDLSSHEQKEFISYASAERYYGVKNKYFSSKAYKQNTNIFTVGNRYKITVLN